MALEPTDRPVFERLCVLMVEDSDNDALILTKHLQRECVRFRSVRVQTAPEMRAALEAEIFDIVLCDHDMPQFSSKGALAVRDELDAELPFIIVTGAIGGEEVAIELMRRGVADFVTKDNPARLVPAIRRELDKVAVRQAKRRAEDSLRRKNEELERVVDHLSRTQAELVRAGRMKGLGRMASGISHEMDRTLARAAELLEIVSPGAEGGRVALEAAKDAVADAARAAKRLTYFCDVPSRERAGCAVDLNTMLAGLLASGEGTCSAGGDRPGIGIETSFDEVPPALGDPEQFRDALATLIGNACESMPGGGMLKVSTYQHAESVVVEIEDDGAGLSPEALRQNLEPVFSDEVGEYPDLGYAWINALLERYGGVLKAESAEGLGTKVLLRFDRFGVA